MRPATVLSVSKTADSTRPPLKVDRSNHVQHSNPHPRLGSSHLGIYCLARLHTASVDSYRCKRSCRARRAELWRCSAIRGRGCSRVVDQLRRCGTGTTASIQSLTFRVSGTDAAVSYALIGDSKGNVIELMYSTGAVAEGNTLLRHRCSSPVQLQTTSDHPWVFRWFTVRRGHRSASNEIGFSGSRLDCGLGARLIASC